MRERNGVTEKDELRLVQQVLVCRTCEERAVSDAINAERFAGEFYESGDIPGRDERSAGTMQQEVCFSDGAFEVRIADGAIFTDGAFNDAQLWKAAVFHRDDFRREIAGGPQDYFRFGKVTFKQGEHARCMGNIADVHDLPGRAQENARVWSLRSRPHA